MNDDQLLQLLRAADPARHQVHFDGADEDLLRRILQTPPVDPRALARARRVKRARLLTARTRLLVPVVGAAALAAAVVLPGLNQADPPAPPAAAPETSAPSTSESSLPVTPVHYTAAAVRVAKANPRLLITAPQWKVRSVGGFSRTSGEMTFQLGPDRWVQSELDADGNELASTPIPNPDAASDAIAPGSTGSAVDNEAPQVSVDWYPRDQYDAYLADRRQESSGTVRVLGQQVDLVSYSATDHAFMLPPRDGVFLEVRGSHLDRASFLALANEHLQQVSVDAWLAAMPAEVVTPRTQGSRLEQVLVGVPRPPGFRGAELGRGAALDRYQFGATVAGAVTCGWIREWERARSAGEDEAADRAAAALRSSHDWKFLKDMDAEGDYPEVVWEIADQVAAGEQPAGYEGALGC